MFIPASIAIRKQGDYCTFWFRTFLGTFGQTVPGKKSRPPPLPTLEDWSNYRQLQWSNYSKYNGFHVPPAASDRCGNAKRSLNRWARRENVSLVPGISGGFSLGFAYLQLHETVFMTWGLFQFTFAGKFNNILTSCNVKNGWMDPKWGGWGWIKENMLWNMTRCVIALW